MGSDWDYINEHMGGHDEDGLPNFMSKSGCIDDSYHKENIDENEKRGDDKDFALTDDERASTKGLIIRNNLYSGKNSISKSAKSVSGFPKRHGAKWTTDEINNVRNLFISGISILKISEIKERTPFSIAWQLNDMELITSEQKKSVKDGNSLIYYLDRNKFNHKPHTSNNNDYQWVMDTHKTSVIENQPKEYLERGRTGNNKIKLGFFEVIMRNFKIYLYLWLAIILVNQIVIFNACFAPHCLFAALPHTGIIAAIITYIVKVAAHHD